MLTVDAGQALVHWIQVLLYVPELTPRAVSDVLNPLRSYAMLVLKRQVGIPLPFAPAMSVGTVSVLLL